LPIREDRLGYAMMRKARSSPKGLGVISA